MEVLMAVRTIVRTCALLGVVALMSTVSVTCFAQRAPAAASASAQKYKGIFEPMNYPDDVTFYNAFFVNDQVGWVSGRGAGGMLLHTVDGGQHWNLQLGNPNSSDPEIKDLHFLDATHGWARQGGNLLRTTDGTNWQVVGTYPGDFGRYTFTSPNDGFESFGPYSGSTIAATHDGGRSWKNVFQCETSLQVNGLTRNVGCMINDLNFPTPRIGYGVGGSFNDGFTLVAKSEDGGATWRVIFASTELAPATGVVFQDENHGVVRLKGGGAIFSADGGRTWQGATGSLPGNPRFADPRVGLSCYSYTCSFTVDGGLHWVSQSLALPASIEEFSAPRRDRAYVVGGHGMIYHYRIVPAQYTAKGIVDAPLVPAYGGPLRGHLDQMRNQVGALQAKLGSAGAASGSAGNASPSVGSASSAPASFGNAASSPAPNPASGPASSANSLSSSNTFSQNAAVAPATANSVSQDPNAQSANFSQDPNAPAGNFSQDTSAQATNFSQDSSVPPSATVQSCCAALVADLQSSVGLMGQQVPSFSGEFRNLNLLFVGLNMFGDLAAKAQAINKSFMSLKQASDPQAALAALQTLSTQISSTAQAIDSGFQNLSAGNASGSSFGNSIGNVAGGAAGTAPPNQNGGAPNNGAQTPPPIPNPVSDAAQKAKDALNKLIHF
jgi:hypothetical protein